MNIRKLKTPIILLIDRISLTQGLHFIRKLNSALCVFTCLENEKKRSLLHKILQKKKFQILSRTNELYPDGKNGTKQRFACVYLLFNLVTNLSNKHEAIRKYFFLNHRFAILAVELNH